MVREEKNESALEVNHKHKGREKGALVSLLTVVAKARSLKAGGGG